jgi:phenylacetic acid degradation operon negative regulatory protein
MVSRAWDLSEVETRYEEFIAEFSTLEPKDGPATLHAQTLLVHEWRRFPFLDPQLPADLLPQNWRGTPAAQLFHRRHQEWRPVAQQHWDQLQNQ